MSLTSVGRKIIPASYHQVVGKAYHGMRVGLRAWRLELQKEAAERLILSHRVGRWLHYRLTSGAFVREHAAVAAGRMRYRKDLQTPRDASYLLRRNVHRIEKGLIMPNRRSVFALDFIGETIKEFAAVAEGFATLSPGAPLSSELKWAHDVLQKYFAVTDPQEPKLARLRPIFATAAQKLTAAAAAEGPAPRSAEDTAFTPFEWDATAPAFAIDDLQALAHKRRSVRSYKQEPVSREVIDRALRVAAESPSACNRQAFSFHIFDDPDQAQKVAGLPMGTKSFVHNIPAVAVLVGHLRAYPRERDRHAIYVDASLAAMSFIYGLEVQGVGSCAINWADEQPAEGRANKMLSLNSDDRVVLMISFGWPADGALVPYSAKRGLDDFRMYRNDA